MSMIRKMYQGCKREAWFLKNECWKQWEGWIWQAQIKRYTTYMYIPFDTLCTVAWGKWNLSKLEIKSNPITLILVLVPYNGWKVKAAVIGLVSELIWQILQNRFFKGNCFWIALFCLQIQVYHFFIYAI